ncbi:MAG: hypothetical protein MUE60_03025 [Candidatus Eisenbacteria bacterium]|nr:hypothetical protein [Candidatus Eisenbacteria bacterium]
MRVIKVLVLHLAFVALFLLVLDRLAAMLLAEPALSRPKAVGTETRTLATWPLRSDPALGWALAPPPEKPDEMGQGYQLSHAGIGLRWLPGTMDMGPPLVMLVLGDETAFGPTGPLQDTFGGGIKRATEERLRDRTMAVATAAVPGYDALQMCLQFKRLTSLRPHLALFCFSAGQTLAPTAPLWRPTSIRPALTKELLYRPSLAQALYLGIDRLTGGTEVSGVSWDVAPERIRQDAAEDFGA